MGLSPDALYQAAYSDVSGTGSLHYEGTPFPGCSYNQYARSYLLHSIIRKWIPKDSSKADISALSSFVSANDRCRTWREPVAVDSLHEQILGETRRILHDFFHPSGGLLVQSLFDILRVARPGPGVNVGAKGTSYYTKYFASNLSVTSGYLYEKYKAYCDWIPFLSDADCQRYEKFGSPSIVSGSKCSFVPKTASTSRMICVEPSLNMYYQLGLATLLEERLRSFFQIDLTTQPSVNHRLARQGSIDCSFATIDLSSASDSISLGMCEYLLPDWFFKLLCELRSRTTEIDGRSVPLFMISTMGNGFTFPLQTIIFSAILKACSSCCTWGKDETWSCFGDDLICRGEIFDRVSQTLTSLGFILNASKTFSEGHFRESCGADWFLGQPVRPVFIKKLDLPYDILVAINQLNDWSAYTGIPLRNTVKLLVDSLETKFCNFVPYDSAYDSGIRVPLAFTSPKFNRNLSFMYYTWERKPTRLRIYEGAIRGPRLIKGGSIYFNPSGLYASFLFGELVSFEIMVRHNRKIFRRKLRCIPYWDYIPCGSLTNGVRLSWQQWETAVAINLAKS